MERSLSEWAKLMETWKRSRLSMADFCQEQGITRFALLQARRRLEKQKDPEAVLTPPLSRRRRLVRPPQNDKETVSTPKAPVKKTELFGTRRGSKAPRASRRPFDLTQASKAPRGAEAPLTVRLVDELAKGALPAGELADRLGESYPRTLRELRELRGLGIVFRAGKGPGSTWVLG